MPNNPSFRPPKPPTSVLDLASVHVGEIHYLGETPIHVYPIGSAYNQGVMTGQPVMPAKLVDLPIETVEKSIPEGRKPSKQDRSDRATDGSETPLLEQPLLLAEVPGGYLLVDGARRFAAAAAAGKTQIRCIVMTPETLREHGRVTIDGVPDEPMGQRTYRNTLPPYEPGKADYAGKDKNDNWREAKEAVDRKEPDSRPAVRRLPDNEPAHSHGPEAPSLLSIAKTEAFVEKCKKCKKCTRVVVLIEARDEAEATRLTFKESAQQELDITIRVRKAPVGGRKRGQAGRSLYEIILILFLKRLFHRVRVTSDAKENQVGYRIVSEHAGWNTWPGAPKDLANWMKVRSDIVTGAGEFFSRPIHDELFRIGASWLRNGGASGPDALREHLFDLIAVAFKCLSLAERHTSNLRRIHAINGDDAPRRSEWRQILDAGVDGIGDEGVAAGLVVPEKHRMLLALHGRLNPAKIWRDMARKLLTYQWLVAIGDLVRSGKMIVTTLMAQEMIIVAAIRANPSHADFYAAWPLFDRALALAVSGRPSGEHAFDELLSLCHDAMAGSYAQVVELSNDAGRCFNSKPLIKGDDRSASIAAEVPTLLF